MLNLETWSAKLLPAGLIRGESTFQLLFFLLGDGFLKGYGSILILRANCGEKMEEFLKRCFYHSGQYDSQEHFTELDKKLKEHEVCLHCSHQSGYVYQVYLILLSAGWKNLKPSLLSLHPSKYICRRCEMCKLFGLICQWLDQSHRRETFWPRF